MSHLAFIVVSKIITKSCLSHTQFFIKPHINIFDPNRKHIFYTLTKFVVFFFLLKAKPEGTNTI